MTDNAVSGNREPQESKVLYDTLYQLREWVESPYPIVHDDEHGPMSKEFVSANTAILTCKHEVARRLKQVGIEPNVTTIEAMREAAERGR